MAVFIELGEKSKNVPKDRRKSFPPPFFSGKAFYQTCPAICVVTGTKIQKQKRKTPNTSLGEGNGLHGTRLLSISRGCTAIRNHPSIVRAR